MDLTQTQRTLLSEDTDCRQEQRDLLVKLSGAAMVVTQLTGGVRQEKAGQR